MPPLWLCVGVLLIASALPVQALTLLAGAPPTGTVGVVTTLSGGGGGSAPAGAGGTLQINAAGSLGAYAGSNVCSASYVTAIAANGSVTCAAVGGGDTFTDTATSVDGEVALFKSTTGKLLQRATLTAPVVQSAAGVLSAALVSGDSPTIATTAGSRPLDKQLAFDIDGNIIASPYDTNVGVTFNGTPVSGQVAEWISALQVQGVDTTGTGDICRQDAATLNSPLIAKLGNLASNGFVKTSSGDGTLSVDTSTYISGNQTITMSGDATASGTVALTATVTKVNGVAYPASPSTDALPVVTAANTITYKVLTDCDDTSGNHLNYDVTTHTFTCGTSSSGGAPGNAVADGSTKGIAAFEAACFNDDGSGLISFDAANCTAADGSTKGLLTAADWTTFNAKVTATRAINTTSPLGGGGNLGADRTLTCTTCTTNASSLTSNLPVIGAGSNATAVGTRSGNTTEFATSTGSKTTSRQLGWDVDGNVTASGVPIGDVSAATVTPAKATNGINRKVCTIIVGSDDGSALANANLGPQLQQCRVPSAATVEEVTVWADGGTPSVIVHRRTGTTNTALLSSALATAASGAEACARPTAVANQASVTCSATLQNVTVPAGATFGLTSGTAGGVAKRMSISITFLITAD